MKTALIAALLVVSVGAVAATEYSDAGSHEEGEKEEYSQDYYTSGYSEGELFEAVSDNYTNSLEKDFSDVWKSKEDWGGVHRMYSIQIDTESLIRNDSMRSDCRDIRVSSDQKIVGSRVQANTCNTEETWIYFSNVRTSGGLVMDPDEEVGNITVHYGNQRATTRERFASEYSAPAVSLLKPESAVEMYYGSHDSARVAESASLKQNDKDAPKHVWHAEFDTYGNSCCNIDNDEADSVKIEQDGQTKSFSNIQSNGDFVLTSSNIPDFVEQGDDITVQFKYTAKQGSGGETVRDSGTAQWGRSLSLSNGNPNEATLQTDSVELSIDVQSDSNTVDLTFFGDGNDLGTKTVSPGTRTFTWSGISDGTHNWYVKADDGTTTEQSTDYSFTVDAAPEISNPDPTGTVDTTSPSLSVDVNDPNDNPVDVKFFNASSDNLIGTTTASTNPDGTADITWSDLSNGSHSWYVKADDSTSTITSNDFQFNVNTPASIANMSFRNKSSGHSFQTSALVKENKNTLDCAAEATADGETDSTNVVPEKKNTSYSWCNTTINYDDESDWKTEHDNNAKLLTPSVKIITEDTSSGKTNSKTMSNTFPNHQPEVVSGTFTYSEIRPIYGFNTTVEITDKDNGDNEISRCTMELTDQDSNSIEVDGKVRYPGTGTECHYNNTNSTLPSGFEVDEEIDINVTVTDVHGNRSKGVEGSNRIPNTEPVLDSSSVRPRDQTPVTQSPVTISASGNDPEGDEVALYFINATGTTNQVLKKKTVSGTTDYSGSYDWNGVRIREPTYWRVKLSDPYTNYTSPTFSFEKVTISSFRTVIEVPERYRTISTTKGTRKSLTFTVRNPSARQKDLNVSLSGVNSSFESGTGTPSNKQVSIGAGGEQQFRAVVQPQEVGSKELVINASNTNTLLNNKRTIPVNSEQLTGTNPDNPTQTPTTREVPGMTTLYMLVLTAGALFFFWFS